MRNNIVHIGAEELSYEIKEIVDVAEKIEALGVKIFWENIGDPIAKGVKVPDWIKGVVKKAVELDESFGYCSTKGLASSCQFLAEQCNSRGGVQITPDDIIFFNGLGDAISKVYTYLRREARVIGPSPAYSTHSSAEAAHAGFSHITYNLVPESGWLPDVKDLRNKVRYNPAVSGILIINPDNPTGMVYPRRILEKIVQIAKDYDLFIITDEIYANIAYGKEEVVSLSEVIDDVPGIAMRGISKEIPWPGARCGWIETYNRSKDPLFDRYIKTLVDAKMLEVCSTTLPQSVIPKIMSDSRYKKHIRTMNDFYQIRAEFACRALLDIPNVLAIKPEGAFYISVVFRNGILNNKQKLKIKNKKAEELVEKLVKNISPDKRFAYYLMASSGICVVPLSGFNSDLLGFRATLLESNSKKFKWIFRTLAEKIEEYTRS